MFLTLGENISTQALSEVSFKFTSFFPFPRCRYATYFACSFHLIELRRTRLALCRTPSFLENYGTTKMFMPLDSHFSTKKKLFSLGILSERILFQNSKCQTLKKSIVQPQVVLSYKGMVFALYSRAGYVFEKKLLFQVQTRVRKIADFGHK